MPKPNSVRSVNIVARTYPHVKEMLEAMADMEERTASNMLEVLILDEAQRRGISLDRVTVQLPPWEVIE